MFACVAFIAAFGGGKIPEGSPSAVTPLAVFGLFSLVYGICQIVTGVQLRQTRPTGTRAWRRMRLS